MSGESFPSEHYYNPPNLSLEGLARRAAIITGDTRLNPDSYPAGDALHSLHLDITPQPDPRVAELVMHTASERNEVPGSSQQAYHLVVSLGLFHAYDQSWHFFDELVPDEDKQAVGWGIEGIATMYETLATVPTANLAPSIDYSHHATKQARAEMHELLAADGTGGRIIERANRNTINRDDLSLRAEADAATDMYLATYLRFIDRDTFTRFGFMHVSSLVRVLVAKFHGIKLINNTGHVVRGNASVRLAISEVEAGNTWVPSRTAITERMWAELSIAPDRLRELEDSVIGFTPDVCAVATHWDTPL